MIEFWTWVAIVLAVLVAIGWYLSYTAARLDRLHTRQYGSLASLDAHLIRRAEAALALATSSTLDPASAVLLVSAASDVLEAPDRWTPEREEIETALTQVLQVALTNQESPATDPVALDAIRRLRKAAAQARLARRFHNEAVHDVLAVRDRTVVRVFHLAGHEPMPRTVVFDDDIPALAVADTDAGDGVSRL